MSDVNVVNRICCFCLIIFLREDRGGFGHPGHPLATPLIRPRLIGSRKRRIWLDREDELTRFNCNGTVVIVVVDVVVDDQYHHLTVI